MMGNAIQGMLFQPPEPTYQADPNLIWLTTRRGQRIPAFFIDKRAPITILFSHGNAEDLGHILHYFKSVCDPIRANIFAYEYTGYGCSSGSPSEDDIYADIEAGYLYLRDVVGVPWDRIVVFGRSMGSAASIHLASLTPVRGLILQCPMLSVFRIVFNSRFTVPGDKLTNIDRIKATEAPILVIHGTEDEIVPFWHGQELQALCNDQSIQPLWVKGGSHNNIESTDKSAFLKRISDFLHELENSTPNSSLRNQIIRI